MRALLLGTTPYAGSLPRDLYAALGFFYPGILSSDDEDLLLQCGGARVLAELLRGLWTTAGQALDDLRGPGGQAFVERVATATEILHRLLDARPAVDIELELDFYAEDAVLLLRDRMDVLLALAGDVRAVARMPPLIWRLAGEQNKGDQAEMLATAVGASLLGDRINLRRKGAALATPFAQWRDYGRAVLARNAYAPRDAEAAPTDGGLKTLKARPPAAAPGSVVVFPASILEGIGRSDNVKEVRRILGDLIDQPLRGVPVPADWDNWEQALIARHPNGGAFIRAVRDSQGGREFWGHAVVCADGPPGTGKSLMCRSIAEVSGLPFKRFQAENAGDNSYGGTPIRWVSAQQDFVTAGFVEHRTRSFVAAIDEIEKAAGSRDSNSGRMHDVLHGQWDRETASRWQSHFLCHEIDLTGVVFLCTSNDAASLPSSLRDRMVIARVEEPTAEHLAALAPQVARELCRDMGLEPAWGVLDSDEWNALRQAWGAGGSIRKLQKLLGTILRARDADPSTPRH
ncbi:AAA family ATPase [Methylorubrum extorquens]